MKCQNRSRMIACMPMVAGMIWLLFLSGCAPAYRSAPLVERTAEGLRTDSRNPEALVGKGRACLYSDDVRGAEQAFRRALDLDDSCLAAYKHLGFVLAYLGRYKESRRVYERALRVSEKDSELWTAYGYCLVDLSKDTEALRAFRRSIDLNTEPVAVNSARLATAALLLRQGDKAAAQREFDNVVGSNPEIFGMLDENK